MKPERRRVWKNFYIASVDEQLSLKQIWQVFPINPKQKGKYTFTVEGTDVETNLPLRLLRPLFRMARVPWRDYVSDWMTLEERYGTADNPVSDGI